MPDSIPVLFSPINEVLLVPFVSLGGFKLLTEILSLLWHLHSL